MMKRLTKFLNLLKNLSNDFFDKETIYKKIFYLFYLSILFNLFILYIKYGNDIFNKYFFIQYKLLIQYI